MESGYIKVLLALGAILLLTSSSRPRIEGMECGAEIVKTVGLNEGAIEALNKRVGDVEKMANPGKIRTIEQQLAQLEDMINAQIDAANTDVDKFAANSA